MKKRLQEDPLTGKVRYFDANDENDNKLLKKRFEKGEDSSFTFIGIFLIKLNVNMISLRIVFNTTVALDLDLCNCANSTQN